MLKTDSDIAKIKKRVKNIPKQDNQKRSKTLRSQTNRIYVDDNNNKIINIVSIEDNNTLNGGEFDSTKSSVLSNVIEADERENHSARTKSKENKTRVRKAQKEKNNRVRFIDIINKNQLPIKLADSNTLGKKRQLIVVNDNDSDDEIIKRRNKEVLSVIDLNNSPKVITESKLFSQSQTVVEPLPDYKNQSKESEALLKSNMAMFEIDYRLNTQPSESSHMLLSKSSKSISNEDHQNQLNSKHQQHMHHHHHLSNSNSANSYHSRQSSSNINNSNSIATLCNIGNTCYLNSVVYTLRFAPFFVHKLHHLVEDMMHVYTKLSQNRVKSSSLGRNVGGLQGQSGRSWSNKDLASLGNNTSDVRPKTHRQIVTEKLHELYQNLHRNEVGDSQEPFHAGTFLQSVQDVSDIFEGNQQQDAHEFLMLLLDSIRETCHSVIKTISDHPDSISNGYSSLPEQSEVEPQLSPRTVKTSFFSKKSKRKEPAKQIPEIAKLQSPVKDTTQNHINANSEIVATTGLCATPSISNEIELTDQEKLEERIKKLDLDFFRYDFEGITVSKTTCLTCETVTEKKETMVDVSIPISSSENNGAIDNPQLFFENACITKEYFRGTNKYRCEECCGYQEAIRSISFELLPRLLIVQLKRFSGGMEKINSYIPTPFTLKCFCNKCYHLTDDKKLHVYKLYSVITHVGATMSVGHYIAYTTSLNAIAYDPNSSSNNNNIITNIINRVGDNNNNNFINSDYINCPKDKRNHLNKFVNSSQSSSILYGNINSSTAMALGGNSVNSQYNNNNNAINKPSKMNFNLIKKFKSIRNKASSSGDLMNKNLVINDNSENNVSSDDGGANGSIGGNGGVTQTTTPIIKTTCLGLNCCGLRVCNYSSLQSTSNINNNSNNIISDIDKIIENGDTTHNGLSTSSSSSGSSTVIIPANNNGITNGINASVTGNNTAATGASGSASGVGTVGNSMTNTNYVNGTVGTNHQNGTSNGNQSSNSSTTSSSSTSTQIWYMCDDDKIKIMTQREFEELLSPNRKIMITPYLLFYARFDENNDNSSPNHNNNL